LRPPIPIPKGYKLTHASWQLASANPDPQGLQVDPRKLAACATFPLNLCATLLESQELECKKSANYTAPIMSQGDVEIRECVSPEDFKQCIELERAVWNDDDIDIMPSRLYMIAKACNAPTIGAFDAEGRLVGFVHTMIGMIDKRAVYHSHMAAVADRLRDKDIGYRMKLAQRDHALKADIPLIIWTFDPLISRNAHFNLNKLGAIVRRYEVNYYGEGVSTMFDPNVPSDRIFAEWWVGSEHVKSALEGRSIPGSAQSHEAAVTIPSDFEAVRTKSLESALEWRLNVRFEFGQQLAAGRIARGFSWDRSLGHGRYLFGSDDPQFRFSS
jgi:predicted GNAT superfamily acetyltransferase